MKFAAKRGRCSRCLTPAVHRCCGLEATGLFDHGRMRRNRPVRRPWDRPSKARVWLSLGVEILVGVAWFALLVAGVGWPPRLAAALTLPVVAAWRLFGWLPRPDGDPLKQRRFYAGPLVRWLHGPDRPPPGFPRVGLREPWSIPDAEQARALTVEAQLSILIGVAGCGATPPSRAANPVVTRVAAAEPPAGERSTCQGTPADLVDENYPPAVAGDDR